MHVGIVGVGTMGEIFAEGLNKEGHKLFAYDVRSERLEEIADRCDLRKAPSNAALIEWSEVVMVIVKPQTFESFIEEIMFSIYSFVSFSASSACLRSFISFSSAMFVAMRFFRMLRSLSIRASLALNSFMSKGLVI